MISTVTLKSDAETSKPEEKATITLDSPSVVTLHFGPEEVTRFDRAGNDLVLVLTDGRKITIIDFFVMYEEERNDIVFLDENGVTWWGQYSEPWETFQIAEIEQGFVPAVFGLAGLAPILGLIGVAAAAGGQKDTVDTVPQGLVIEPDNASVTGAGITTGDNDPQTGEPQVEGDVLVNDTDTNGSGLTVIGVARDGVEGTLGAQVPGIYGTLVLNPDGTYIYVLDNTLETTQSLGGDDIETDVFTYTVIDPDGRTATTTLTILVEGTNDLPQIGGLEDGSVQEDGSQSAVGQLTVDDVDIGDSHIWSIPGSTGQYGTLIIDETGGWSYTLDNGSTEVQALPPGQTLSDVIRVRVTDSDGGSTVKDVVITILGTNDRPAPQDDESRTTIGQPVSSDVLANDDDVDTGDTLTITHVDGQTISVGLPVTLSDGSGIVSIGSDGRLTFQPDPGFVGNVSIPYTVDDSSGTDNATDTANWVISVVEDTSVTEPVTQDPVIVIPGGSSVPLAIDDSATVVGGTGGLSGSVSGNVITGPGTDSVGADGAIVTSVTVGGVATPVPATGTVDVVGLYGTLTIASDGSYTYTRAPGTPGGVEDAFGYTLTDGDGDTDTAVLTVDIGDAPVSIGGLDGDASGSDAVVNESKLPTGTQVGADDDSVSGSFTVTAFDGIDALSLTAGGNSIDIVAGGTPAGTPLSLTSALGSTLVITGFDPATGVVEYTYTLADGETHSGAGRDDLLDGFAISLTDLDGSTASDTLNIRIVDDAPVITAQTAPVALATTDADLANDPAADFSVLFDPDHGADGADATVGTVYSLEVPSAGVASGVVDTASGDPVLLFLENGVLVGRVGGQSGPAAFSISVDAGTGVVTLDQLRALDHPSAGVDVVSLVNTAAVLRLTVQDGDGDTATQTAEIGARFSFGDDIPSTDLAVNAGFSAPVLNTQDGDTLAGADTARADFSGAFQLTNDLGNDGAAALNGEVLGYALGLQGGATSVPSGLSSEGNAITLHLVGGTIIGSTEMTVANVNAANTVFRITQDGAGQVTLTQTQPVDHADTGDNADIASLAAGLVTLSATSDVTDGDGDTAQDMASVNIGASFSFTDDGPTVGNTPDGAVAEADLRVPGATLTASGDITADVGADRESAPMGVAFDAAQTDLAALGLSSAGTALVYTITNGVITATAGASGPTVFTATLTQPTAGNGYQPGYDYVQSLPLDHPASGADTLALPFALTVTDGDGDTASTGFDIVVTDDIPSAAAQTGVTVVEGGAAIGSSNGGVNLLANDTPGADGALLHQVRYVDDAGVTQTAVLSGATTGPLDTQYGTLIVAEDGSWSFTPDAALTHTAGAPLDASFSYTLRDTDGDITPFTNQPVTVTDTTPTAIDDSAIVLAEGAPSGSGNVVTNDAASADGGTTIDSFTYTNASGAETTFTFASSAPASQTVVTPTGTLVVNNDGTWTFTQSPTFDHDAPGADATAGSFSYILRDADGSLSNDASQVITVTDTDPVSSSASFSLDEKDLPSGSAMGASNPTTTQSLQIVKGPDNISDVVFTAATLTGLGSLTSDGTALTYALSGGDHTVTASAGSNVIFTLQINNPTDVTGASQSITATMSGPLDQPAAALTLLNVAYEVRDIDSAINSTATFIIVDDTPLTPVNDAIVNVVESGTIASFDNLLDNDVLGADGGLLYDITYTDRSGATQTAVVPVAGLTGVETQYGTLNVAQNGTWSYVPVDSADHVQPGNDLQLNDDFTYRTIDGDGDISGGSGTQPIVVTDTVPGIGNPVDGTVDEANLPNGSAPGTPTTSGSLDLVPGEDSFDTVLSDMPIGLTANGVGLEYEIAADGHSAIAYQGAGRTVADQVFTVALTNPTTPGAGYSFTLLGPLDHGTLPSIDLAFGVQVTDSDDDTDQDSFVITVLDDTPATTIAQTIPEDGTFSVNTSADATPANTVIWQGGVVLTGVPDGSGNTVYTTDNGTVTVRADGSISYEPADNYSGPESFEVVTNDGGPETRTTVNMTVTPVSDAPTMSVDTANINTLEDTAVAMGLNAPVITDDGTGTGNNTVTERIGLITLTGLPAGAILSGSGTGLPFNVGTAPVTVLISDVPTLASATTADLTLTTAEYEALNVQPPLHTSEEFTVTATVSSFEVDGSGNQIAGVAGAQQIASVIVDVQAVTDDAALLFNGVAAGTVSNVDAVTYAAGNTEATVEIKEDTNFNLKALLAASFQDDDQSEVRSITITNGSGQPIRVGTATVNAGADITLNDLAGAAGQTNDINSFANILVGGIGNFSGVLNDITVTINAQDVDSDGFIDGTGTQTGTPEDGVPEANLANNSVTLNLVVTPVAGDVVVDDVSGDEDKAIAFLAGVRVTDTTTGTGGTEVIDEVRFAVPAGWDVGVSTVSNSATFTAGDVAGVYTITFTGGSQADREAVLDGFTITPPNHSSLDAAIALSIDTTDTAGTLVDTTTTSHTLTIEVAPVAELIAAVGDPIVDTDDNGTADLAMSPDFTYSTSGVEDQWFALNSDGYDLSAGWLNEDADEDTFAQLTPVVTVGDVPGASVIGAQFRWDDGSGTQREIYAGTPIDIPLSALATVEFLPPNDFAGQFKIDVQAFTVDYDDDTEGTGTPAEAVSGEAELLNILVAPQADPAALTLTARVIGLEDTPIPLLIRPSSADKTETFNITIGNIPTGAVIIYNGNPLVITSGSVSIENFDRDAPMTIQPPLHSNDDFALTVDAVSVDTVVVDGTTYTDTSAPVSLNLSVAVRGVADEAIITPTPMTYIESELDDDTATIALSDLVTVALVDSDGSESLTVRVSGLEEGFSLSSRALLTPPSLTGVDRVWALNAAEFAATTIDVPENYSGEVSFNVGPVTTENDGDSLTGTPQAVTFSVTPSTEALVTTSAVLVEDVITSIGFGIDHQNGDTDETLGNVRININDPATWDFDLYVDTGGSFSELTAAGLPQVSEAGQTYYELTAAQAQSLSALTKPHDDGDLGSFDLLYQIIDENFGTVASGTTTTSAFQPATFALSATPVTDPPEVSITAISGTAGITTATDQIAGDDADPDTASLNDADIVTVTLNIASPDFDGSERVIRVIIEDVPNGVTVLGAQVIGVDSWLLVYDGAASLPINAAGGITLPVQFDVSDQLGNLAATGIDMTVQVMDRADETDPGTLVLTDTVTWNLETTFGGGGPGETPVIIDDWEYTSAGVTEDTPTLLSTLINGSVDANSLAPNTLTVQLTDLPPGTIVTGMTRTVIGGVETWTASVTSAQGDDDAAVQALLDNLLMSITLTSPENVNDNNTVGGLPFTATLTAKVLGGNLVASDDFAAQAPIDPVTDPADISIGVSTLDNDGVLEETDPSVALTINVTNPADGAAGSIVNGLLYVQIGADTALLEGGTLTDAGGTAIALTPVTGVAGIPDGDYFVVPNAVMGTPIDVIYNPPTMAPGNITVTALAQNVETGSVNLVASQTQTLPVGIANNGVTATTAPTTGTEPADSDPSSAIELSGLSVSLIDNDGSEELVSILLTDVPEGFLVIAGVDAASATTAGLSDNAGGNGLTNTWLLADAGGSLPPYIAILPPQNWSGTISGINLAVTSGETTLDEVLPQIFPVDPITVTPVANGVELLATNTFGNEEQIVPLNLNLSLTDALDATLSPNAPDENLETVTLELTGMGPHASFYVGTTLIEAGISYNAGSDVYTLTGLDQAQIDALGFLQAISSLTDAESGTPGLQIGISAFSVDGASTSAVDTDTITAVLTPQLPTSGSDTLLWTGQTIFARGGTDTVMFRQGESLSGATLEARLNNVEILDLTIAGANNINGLTPEHLREITRGGNALSIQGTAEDLVSLSGTWVNTGGGIYQGTITEGGIDTFVSLTVTGAQVLLPFSVMSLLVEPAAPTTFVAPLIEAEEPFGLAMFDAAENDTHADLLPGEEPFAGEPLADDPELMAQEEAELLFQLDPVDAQQGDLFDMALHETQEPLGLASLDGIELSTLDQPVDQPAPDDQVTLEMVLGAAEEEDLTALLPAEETPAPATSVEAAAEFVPPSQPWDEDLQDTAVYES